MRLGSLRERLYPRLLYVASKVQSKNFPDPKISVVRALTYRERGGRDRDFPARKPQHHSFILYIPVAMGVEDQQEEREVLESIFPEEITGKLF